MKTLPSLSAFQVISLILLMTCNGYTQTPLTPPATTQQQEQSVSNSELLTNKGVLEMVKAGLGGAIIIAKIKASHTKFDTSLTALQELKTAGVTDDVILAMIEASSVKPASEVASRTNKRGRMTDELTSKFKQLQTSVVTVWSEIGHGTGFIFDVRGLVMTNQHVIGPSTYVAVQFDDKRKVGAKILAVDPQKDVAVLWIDPSAFPEATPAVIAKATDEEPVIIEGERVLTIGSPLNQRKVMTTGIASKVEERAIISDININHGNSGGPLFNSLGEVVGITTFGDLSGQGGPGISGIVRIEQTFPVIEEAKARMGSTEKPDARLLPVDPAEKFPLEAIKDVVEAKKFDFDPYFFGMSDYQVALITPPMYYRRMTEAEREAAKTKNKRNNKEGAVQNTFRPTDEFRNWAEYVGEYKPVLLIQAQPNLGESFWGAIGRGVAANYGIHTQANLRFKTDFYRMKLFCGDKEVEPIHPGKIFLLTNERNYFVKSNDATYVGFYSYPAEAINNQCSSVRLELYSEKKPNEAKVKVLDKKTVARITNDFQPYLMRSVRRSDSPTNTNVAGASTSTDSPDKTSSSQEASSSGRNGIALYQQGKIREAEVALTQAIETAPDNVVYRRLLGLSLLDQNKWALAEVQLREAVKLDSSDDAVHDSLGIALTNQRKLKEAESEFREALRLSPNNLEYQKHLQVVLDNQKK